MKKVLLFLLVAVVLLVAVLLFNTFSFKSKQISVESVPLYQTDDAVIQRLSQAIQFQTISYQDSGKMDTAQFNGLHRFLKTSFPLIDSLLTLEKINTYSLLYKWQGSNPSLKPILLMAHQDVVPVDPLTLPGWAHPPFQGVIKDGFVFGRGALDIKSGITGEMEAVEYLLREGFKPERTVYLAYGHDEEIGGRQGALQIANHLQQQKVELEYVLDEGGSIISGIVPGIDKPVAIIGIAEKGYVSLELSVEEEGGHSSMPPKQSAIGILSAAISKLETHPFPSQMDGVGTVLFDYVGPEMKFGMRLVFANRWLFGPVIESQLDKKNSTRAAMHTTTAATIFKSGEKENVLPIKAKAVVNFRIMPGDSVQGVIDYVKQIINDERIKLTTTSQEPDEPSGVSDLSSSAFGVIHKTTAEIFPDVLVAPYLVLGATDSKHYKNITKNIFRFEPTRLDDADLKRIHGTDERISIQSYKETISFYIQLIKNSNEPSLRTQ
ncbi:MAG: M20 family peptidase [Bacteroidia bacterium]